MPGCSFATMSCVTKFPCWMSILYGLNVGKSTCGRLLHPARSRTTSRSPIVLAMEVSGLPAPRHGRDSPASCTVFNAVNCEYDNRRSTNPTGTHRDFALRSEDDRPQGH